MTVEDVFAPIGILVVVLIGILIFVMTVVVPINAGHWAIDRFGQPYDKDSVILRQDPKAKALWICADGTNAKPMNCLSVEDILSQARLKPTKAK